jgi:hypothetical protein
MSGTIRLMVIGTDCSMSAKTKITLTLPLTRQSGAISAYVWICTRNWIRQPRFLRGGKVCLNGKGARSRSAPLQSQDFVKSRQTGCKHKKHSTRGGICLSTIEQSSPLTDMPKLFKKGQVT